MKITKLTSCFFLYISTALFLLTPLPSFAFQPLDIFYSNDIGGHTEPCG